MRSILTALAIALGVGMVLAAAIVGQAAGRTASGLSDEGPRTDLQVFARDESLFDNAVLDRLRAFPDVEFVLPALRVEAEGIHPAIPRLVLLGVDPEAYRALHEPELVSGAFLDGPDTLVLPVTIALRHGLHKGDEFTLTAGERTVTLTVSGRLAAEHDGNSLFRETSAMAFVPLDAAQILAGAPGQIDCVQVALRPGVDVDWAKSALAQQIGTDLVVVRAEVAGGIAFNTLLIQGGLVMVGMIILFAAGFVILNAFAMSTTARTREIGALRALGMTRRQVIRTVLAEAGLLGLVGAGTGMLAGLGLAWGVMRAMGLLGDVPFIVPWWGMVFSPFLGLGVTLAGALQPAWRASRVPPLVAVRSETTIASGWYIRSGGRVGLVLLLLVLPALAAYGQIVRPGIWMAMAVTGVGIATLLIATVLLLPAMVVPTAAFCRPVLVRWLSTAGRLAADNLGRNKLRSALTAGALVAGLTMMTATSGLLTLFLEGSIGLIGPMSHEDIFVIRDFVAMMASGEMSLDNVYQAMSDFTLDPALAGDLDPLVKAGVIEIERVGIAPVPPELATVPTGIAGGMFVDPEVFLRIGNFDFFKGDPETALEWMQRGRAVLLQPLAAERLGVSVGDTIPIETSRGEIDFTVAGVGGSSLFSPIFSYADGEAYFDLAGLFQLNIVVREGEDIEAVLAQVQEIVRPFPGVVAMRDVDAVIDEATRMFDQFQTLLKALLLLAAVVAALGVVNTMVINVAERGREIGLLRAVGATQRQVRRAVVAEAATLGLTAAFIASGLGLAMLLVYVLVVTPNGWGALGVRADGATIWRSLLSALGDMGVTALVSLIFAPLVAALAAIYPARQAAAMNVVEATRSERVTLKRTMAIRPRDQHARRFPRSIEFAMARRNLEQNRLRTLSSGLAVVLGTATIVAADVTGEAIRNAGQAIKSSQDTVAFVGDFLNSGLSIMGLVILAAAGFLIFNAFGMAVTQRQQQIGALRSLGMTRRQVMRLVLAEALLIGGGGTLVGLMAGPLLGRGLVTLLAGLAGVAHGQGSVQVGSLLRAAALGGGITLLATLLPASRAARIAPLVALRAREASGLEGDQKRRAALGLLLITLLAVYLAIKPPAAAVLSPPWDIVLTALFALGWLAGLALTLPFLVSRVSRGVRRIGGRRGAIHRLIADNMRRARRRVTLTIVTLSIGLMMIVSVTGITTFSFEVILTQLVSRYDIEWIIGSLPSSSENSMVNWEVLSKWSLDTMRLSPEFMADLETFAAGRANVTRVPNVIVPELAIMSGIPSFVVDPGELRRAGLFTFTEGDWETAQPIMESGCGLLLMPRMARQHDVGLYDTLTLSGVSGPVTCTVAGLGTSSFMGSSIVSAAAGPDLGLDPDHVFVTILQPLPGVNRETLRADLDTLLDRYPENSLIQVDAFFKDVSGMVDTLQVMLNGMLLLAILAAALGVINTTLISVGERRHELGLLRAVGATRRQVIAVVAGEAASMGVIGGGVGLIAGVGLVLVFVAINGGNMWGLSDLSLWPSAWASLRPALLNGFLGLITAPLICAGAAWLPARSILHGSAVETMQPARPSPVSPHRVAGGLLLQGNIRTRFMLGTVVLTTIVLAGLIGVVTAHEQRYLEDMLVDIMSTMVKGQASLIEWALPGDAQTLTFSDLQMGQFDAEDLLHLRALIDDVSTYGLEAFVIADAENVALLSLDPRRVGDLLPALAPLGKTEVRVERKEEWRIYATSPIQNKQDQIIGSVRLTANLAEMQAFLQKTRHTLWAVGGGIVVAGLALSWALARPLAAAGGESTAQQEKDKNSLSDRPRWRGLSFFVARTSLQTRLTVALAITLVLLVGALERVVIPFERRHVESKLKEGMVAASSWLGEALSEGLAAGLLPDRSFEEKEPEELLSLVQMLNGEKEMDWASLQALSEQMRSEDVAYVAMVDETGVIQLSDQLALIGEPAPLPARTQVEESRWREEKIWAISTPLQRGRDGEQIGALRLGVRRARVETFLDESQGLFRLAGLIAVLGGVLLAQAIGGAVTIPLRQEEGGAHRPIRSNLERVFQEETQDELALLATAFNQMVIGLQEREWLRDTFGRFVSHEVAEAIRTGQVRLEGENRVVSVLFCDILDFAARSAQSTPEETVVLLNDYLPVVVEAAQQHEGTVNKFGGESTLVIYGAPRRLQESAYRAVLTALEIRDNLQALNARLAERGQAPIRIGVGINTGVVLAGAVGPKERQEYTVIGDTVNLASRIEALSKMYPEYEVLVSGTTYEALGGRRKEFEFAPLGEVPIRGKAEPVRVWAVVEKKEK